MSQVSRDEIRMAVRDNYAVIAEADESGCCSASSVIPVSSSLMGYTDEELAAIPEGADLGLGCGNPGAIASMTSGEIVLDLGSGAGFDAFLSARAVGETGHVIGVDMTPAMVSKARANAEKGGYTNVEFRLGEIEHLPVADDSIDVIISNCVINLSPDKSAVFADSYRVLKPGGRLAISDVVATAEIPADVADDLSMYTGCISGASSIQILREHMEAAGFTDIRIAPKDESKIFMEQWAPGRNITDYLVSATIEAVKPSA